MSQPKNTALTVLATLIMVLASMGLRNVPVQTVQGTNLAITLNGHFLAWNYTENDNPPLTVTENDVLSLRLKSIDAPVSHRFFVDVNKNGIDDECPLSITLSDKYCSKSFGSAQISFPMTVDFQAGGYVYYCAFHATSMLAPFTVLTGHDVAVSGITPSRSFSYEGVFSNAIQIDVTATNFSGVFSETFDVIVRVGVNTVGTQAVTIPAGGSRIVTVNFDPLGFVRGSYTLSAEASAVPGETSLANNIVTDGSFVVRLKGDVTNDCAVNIDDLARVGSTFGKTTASPGFDTNADLNNDGAINIDDLAAVGSSFGRIC